VWVDCWLIYFGGLAGGACWEPDPELLSELEELPEAGGVPLPEDLPDPVPESDFADPPLP